MNKSQRKSIKPKYGSLKRSIKLITSNQTDQEKKRLDKLPIAGMKEGNNYRY